ncbi:MAG: amidohydrolase family protein [Chloroflexota bacterium]|jgi:carbamoyl-phosphate synthase/aspartate carbamoyltransferase/dihydroorotase|nr:amidohydrolase family protein [Chloroflexota bacterium]
MKLPGLIDPHVHMREPGATYKEDWSSGTAAALAGGFTQVLAMPNTQPPILDKGTLGQAYALAAEKAYCDYGQYLGAGVGNVETAPNAAKKSAGLKMYLNQTFGPLRLDAMTLWLAHFKSWPKHRPLVAHAEGQTLAAAILMAAIADRPLHLAHVATREDILIVRAAKEHGLKITCEATPHHLFLTQDDLKGGCGEVRPRLGTKEDVNALWENLAVIDCFATDHAPHTQTEKDSPDPPPGFPGLETALPLFLTAVHEGRLTLDDLIQRMSDKVRQIFKTPLQPETWVEVDLDTVSTITAEDLHTKADWSPFEGWETHGSVRRVTLRGETAFEDGNILVPPGFGQCIY